MVSTSFNDPSREAEKEVRAQPVDSSGTDRELMSAADVGRTISRIAHQIIEKTALDGPDAPRVILLGIPTRGVALAARLADKIREFAGVDVPHGALDITLYRDDLNIKPPRPLEETSIPEGGIDDTAGGPGRRRAVLRPLGALGARRAARHRPAARGAAGGARRPRPPRTPAAADYVGKNVPTSRSENVKVRLTEHDGHDGVTSHPTEVPSR